MKTLYVDDGSDLLESVGNLSGSDRAAWRAILAAFSADWLTSTPSPSDPPPVIELCATGVGFDGTQSKNCIRYYTGEVWEGEIHVTNDVLVAGGCDFTWDGSVTLTVSADGAVDGTGDLTVSGCPGIGGSFPVGGHATAEGFVLSSSAYFLEGLTLTRTGNRATGPITYDDRYNRVVGQIEVTCVTCEEAVG